jgi:hypothetical protein
MKPESRDRGWWSSSFSIIFVETTGWPQFINHISSTHKTQSIRDTENWFTLLERIIHQVQ